eukprot:CAMPEP_0181438392 /NCGR_PEP_ID=MMETSP1110-20121109/21885_1 /TAXON_ID=174948 /ORGANISM="Symbiodinium sp., Strain CCMP421" /LENGTH=54 /DNA_ID=CAMNT_0023562077 /DNA_START=17 /DNA_END=177 /DNA_ORIENTATION=+
MNQAPTKHPLHKWGDFAALGVFKRGRNQRVSLKLEKHMFQPMQARLVAESHAKT